jgi:hypothetical protein
VNYQRLFRVAANSDFFRAVRLSDPAYAALNWMAGQFRVGIWFVNFACGLLSVYGLARFANKHPNPWLMVAVAVPYLVIVVGMGYSRQAVAIALTMIGLTAISEGSFGRFVLWTLAGALFHRTAVLMIPVVAISYTRNRLQAFVVGAIGCVIGYYILQSGFDRFQEGYLNRTLRSEGAGIRLAMNLPPAVIFLLLSRRFAVSEPERVLWRNLSIIAVVSFVALFFVKSSTALDRIALYIIPLQLFVLGRIPYMFAKGGGSRAMLITLVILYAATVQYIWLNYSINARNWIPYRIYPFT